MADRPPSELPTAQEWHTLRTDHAKLRIAYVQLYAQHMEILDVLTHEMDGDGHKGDDRQ